MSDLISRQAAINEATKDGAYGYISAEELAKLPSVSPDLSGYSDKIWKAAYERGKAEAQLEIIHCKECEYGEQDEIGRWYCRGFGCQVGNEDGSGFCSDAERREDD